MVIPLLPAGRGRKSAWANFLFRLPVHFLNFLNFLRFRRCRRTGQFRQESGMSNSLPLLLFGTGVIFLLITAVLPSGAISASIQLPKTGQTKCYTASGTEVACAGTGQDGEIQAGAAWPSPRFANPDGTAPINGNIVLDKLTGLEWPKDAGTPAAGSCTGGTKTWQQALDYVACLNTNNYLGHNDWRLPNINELEGFLNVAQTNIAAWLNTQGFSNVQADVYWSSTTASSGASASTARGIFILAGFVNESFVGKTEKHYVWPVRSGSYSGTIGIPKTGQTTSFAAGDDGDLEKGIAWPSPRFTDNNNGTVTDNLTGLIWLKDANCFGTGTWSQALISSNSLSSGSCGLTDGSSAGAWRLPNRKELKSLVDAERINPALPNGHPFSNVQSTVNGSSSCYWSSTTYPISASYDWGFTMGDGHMDVFHGKTGSGYIWPVRDGTASVPVISVDQASLDFGTVDVGSTPSSKTLTITNTGTANLTLSEIGITGTYAQDFAYTGSCSAITPGAACAITVTFSPVSMGAKNATLGVKADIPGISKDIPLSGSANDPSVAWIKTLGGNAPYIGMAIKQTNDGGYIIAGETQSNGRTDIYLLKTDASGNMLWDKIFAGDKNSESYSVQQTSDGGYIVSGYRIPAGGSDQAVSLIKTDSAGNMQWQQTYAAYKGYGASVLQTKDGGYLVGTSGAYLIKTDTSGNIVWANYFGKSSAMDWITSVVETADGYYAAILNTLGISGTVDGTILGAGDTLLIKVDANGLKVWEKSFGGDKFDKGNSLYATSDGGYVFVGQTTSFGVMGDIYFVKTDASGNKQWEKFFGTAGLDEGNSVQQTTDGGYIIAGIVRRSDNTRKALVIKTGVDGVKQWEKEFEIGRDDIAWCIQQTADGGYIITGWSYPASGYIDVLLIKLKADVLHYSLSVSRAGTGNGSVASGDGLIACGSHCSGLYVNGTEVALTASPEAGSAFVHWSGDCAGSSSACTITLASPKDVTAVFSSLAAPVTPVPKTGQKKCYYGSVGTEITCAGTGQDGETQAGAAWPNPRFTSLEDGTIQDTLTGLMWPRDGSTPSFSSGIFSCGGGLKHWSETFTYVSCLNMANYLGHSDWRLPNATELRTLFFAGDQDLMQWLLAKGFSKLYGGYWSSTTHAADTGKAYLYIPQLNGAINAFSKTDETAYVLPVRPGQDGLISLPKTGQTTGYADGDDGALQKGAAWPSPRFTDNLDGTVSDRLTGLVWTKDANAPGPSACNPSGNKDWSAALDYIACLNTNTYLGFNDWRLPNVLELYSLVDYSQSTKFPAGHQFVNTKEIYLSSTTVRQESNVWGIAFGAERFVMIYGEKLASQAVWPVRGGITGDPDNVMLKVTKSGITGGKITSSAAGINCGADCAEVYKAGIQVTLAAVPDAGSKFIEWSGACSGLGACTITMDDDKNVNALFDIDSGPAYTELSLSVSSETILQGAASTINVAGKLTRLPEVQGADLSGLAITFKLTAPDGSFTTVTTQTRDADGHYVLDGILGFTQKGTYVIEASFEGNSSFASSSSLKTSGTKYVLVGASAGYAIIIEGKIAGDEGLASHNKTANRIYKTLKDRGFLAENIRYFNYDDSQTGVYGVPSKSAIQYALQTWVKNRINSAPAPLYIIMVDHGNPGAFLIGEEAISPADINGWLDTLENGLNANAINEKRIVVIGACYSGSFIPALSKNGRIVITSAAADEQSYKGTLEPDNVRAGEYFIEEFFKGLGHGYTLKKGFEEATAMTETYTRKGGMSANASNRYLDDSVQHPQLDDNGDGKGSNALSKTGDGSASEGVYLGIGITYDANAGTNPAELVSVTDTIYLDASSSSALLWAKPNSSSRVDYAWMEIRSPTETLQSAGGSNQLEINNEKLFLEPVAANARWEKTYSSFIEPGKYDVFYYVRDRDTQEISRTKRSVVYKAKAGNNAPAPFTLVSPFDNAEISTFAALQWNLTTDPDNDPLTYRVRIASDSNFTNEIYNVEGITEGYYVMPKNVLSDLATYYWKVIAVDQYGATAESPAWKFYTNNTNGFPGIITGIFFSDLDYSRITTASLTATIDGINTNIPVSNGTFVLAANPGTVALASDAEGYQRYVVTGVNVQAGEVTTLNIGMVDVTNPTPGDLDGSGQVDLQDAILALQVMAGKPSAITLHLENDVNGDGKIGMADVIYILQKIAGTRAQ